MTTFNLSHGDVGTILTRALDGVEISWQEALHLCETSGADFHATVFAADELRRRQVGDLVTYVINRNINFTNVCETLRLLRIQPCLSQRRGLPLANGRDHTPRSGGG